MKFGLAGDESVARGHAILGNGGLERLLSCRRPRCTRNCLPSRSRTVTLFCVEFSRNVLGRFQVVYQGWNTCPLRTAIATVGGVYLGSVHEVSVLLVEQALNFVATSKTPDHPHNVPTGTLSDRARSNKETRKFHVDIPSLICALDRSTRNASLTLWAPRRTKLRAMFALRPPSTCWSSSRTDSYESTR